MAKFDFSSAVLGVLSAAWVPVKADSVAAFVGAPVDKVEASLAALVDDGCVQSFDDEWQITEVGLERVDSWV